MFSAHKFIKATSSGPIFISIIFWGIFVLMLPLYNSAWWDDFSYIRTAESLIVNGQLKIHEWSMPWLVSQVLWSYLTSFIFGFSIISLKLSVVSLFFIGLLFYYLTLREIKIDKFYSTWFTLLLLAYPWSMLLGYSYMTEIPYASWIIISLYFYLRGINKKSLFNILLGSIFSALALLTRQTALVIPISFFLTLFLKRPKYRVQKKKYYLELLFSLAIPVITYLVCQYWLNISNNKTVVQYQADSVISTNIRSILDLNYKSQANLVYSDIVHRVGFYLAQLLGSFWPVLLIFSFPLIKIKKILNLASIGMYLLFLSIFLFALFFKNYQEIGWVGIDKLHLPRELFYFRRFFWPTNLSIYDVWGWSILLSLPIFSLLFMKLTVFIWGRYFYWKLRISKKWFLFSCSAILIGIIVWFFFAYLDLSTRYTQKESIVGLWLFFLVKYILVMFTFLVTVGINCKNLPTKDLSHIFLLLTFASSLFLTSILPYHWPRYMSAFIPFVIILMASFSKHKLFNRTRLILVTIFLLFISFVNSKATHTIHGSIWEVGQKLVSQGIDPKEIDASMMAWYPYWYYSQNYKEAIAAVGGDKKKIVRLTAWEDPSAESMNYFVSQSKNKCPTNSLAQLKVDTLFIHMNVCGNSSK